MTRLILKFPTHNLTIHAVPERTLNVARMVKHRYTTLIQAVDKTVYCTSFRRGKGVSIADWDDCDLDYIACLQRLGAVPRGTLKQARENQQQRKKAENRRYYKTQLAEACQKLGLKTPKVK